MCTSVQVFVILLRLRRFENALRISGHADHVCAAAGEALAIGVADVEGVPAARLQMSTNANRHLDRRAFVRLDAEAADGDDGSTARHEMRRRELTRLALRLLRFR